MEFLTIFIKDKTQNIQEIILPNDPSFSLMELLRAAELPILGTCGGMALCASCHIYIHSNHTLPQKSDSENLVLDGLPNSQINSRLSCQLRMNDSLDKLFIELATD
jgi:2Fe-2S ferredoxin